MPQQQVVHFGPFAVDLKTGELQKHGRKTRLHGQPLQVLSLLLERPGELVTREDLRSRLWDSGTFVDFEHGLHAAVNKLRAALTDAADHPATSRRFPDWATASSEPSSLTSNLQQRYRTWLKARPRRLAKGEARDRSRGVVFFRSP